VQGLVLGLHAGFQLGVSGAIGEPCQLGQVIGPGDQAVPRPQLLAQAVRGAQDTLGLAGVVPEVGLGGTLVESGQLVGLGGEVKDAPTSSARATPARG
jgi:hypothetical protein